MNRPPPPPSKVDTMSQQPPNHPSTAPLPTPSSPPTTAPVTVGEWRVRRESRANAVTICGVALFVEASVLRTGWFAMAAFVLAVALILIGVLLRPTLPWRVPRGAVGSATGTDHEGQPTTGENPLVRPRPARPVAAVAPVRLAHNPLPAAPPRTPRVAPAMPVAAPAVASSAATARGHRVAGHRG